MGNYPDSDRVCNGAHDAIILMCISYVTNNFGAVSFLIEYKCLNTWQAYSLTIKTASAYLTALLFIFLLSIRKLSPEFSLT